MKKNEYHSALKKEIIIDVKIIDRFCKNNSIGFVFDINNDKNLPMEYDKCDIIYSEPAWRDGYEKFMERSGSKNYKSYYCYLESISNIINENKKTKTVVILAGKAAHRYLPKSDKKINVVLHGYKTQYLIYNCNIDLLNNMTNYDFINFLSNNYNCVGDFSCGYGNTALIFNNNGKNFITSDVNAKCITRLYQRLIS